MIFVAAYNGGMTNDTTHKQPSRFAIGVELYETARNLRRVFDKRARALGFTQGQWHALLKLGNNPGVSQVRLADMLDMQPISLARMLDRMAIAGLVERRPDPNDRRAVQLYLTTQAEPVLKVLREMADDIRTLATKDISEAEQAQVITTLRQMRANFEAAQQDDLPEKKISKT